eukprot:scaffold43637_cov24-Attheya_sp.AAC.1
MSNVQPEIRGKNRRSAEYTIEECIMICQAFISVSEDAISGTSQKQSTFNANVMKKYQILKKQNERRQTLERRREARVAAGDVSDEEEIPEVRYPERTAGSRSNAS